MKLFLVITFVYVIPAKAGIQKNKKCHIYWIPGQARNDIGDKLNEFKI